MVISHITRIMERFPRIIPLVLLPHEVRKVLFDLLVVRGSGGTVPVPQHHIKVVLRLVVRRNIAPACSMRAREVLQLAPIAAHAALIVAWLGRVIVRLVPGCVIGEAVCVLEDGIETVHRVAEWPGKAIQGGRAVGTELVEDRV